jgi:4,5-dihydroxyphthalate decarboxylase
LIALSRGVCPYVAVPAFLSRMFRHSAIYIRTDRGIAGPQDLRGRTVGVPEYQMSAVMWVRGFLKDEFGIEASDINWVQGGLESPGRRDKFPLNLPAGFPLTSAGGATLSSMLAEGRLDAVMSARVPSCFASRHPQVRRLFPDYRSAEQDYYRRTGIFPIMHAVGIKRELLEQHPWLAASIYKAFVQAKRFADAEFVEITALKIGLPWVAFEFDATQDVMGQDFWSYGVPGNRKALEAMARYSYEQGLAVRLLTVEEMFAPGTLGVETQV